MKYPEDFKKDVKKVYPNWKELHHLMDDGDIIVGRYLYDSLPGMHNKTGKGVYEAREKNKIFDKWRELFLQQH